MVESIGSQIKPKAAQVKKNQKLVLQHHLPEKKKSL